MNLQAAYGLLAHGVVFGALATLLPLGELRPRPEGLEDLAAYCSALAGVKARGTAETKAPLMRRLFGKKGHAG